MKHLTSILHSSLFILHSSLFIIHSTSASAAEVVVYSRPSASPLHVAFAPTNDLTKVGERVFPASYTGHRSVCVMPPETSTNDVFTAWTGDGPYSVGDPYGTSRGRAYPQVELTPESPIVPRIDLVSDKSDRAPTIADIYEGITNLVYELAGNDARALAQMLADRSWMQSNRIETVTCDPEKETRVRVVRWLVDGQPCWRVGVTNEVVFDKTFAPNEPKVITERDFLSEGSYDIDWDHFQDVVHSTGVRQQGLPLRDIDYLVVFEKNLTGPYREFNPVHLAIYDTNKVVKALSHVVRRTYSETRRPPTASGPSGSVGPDGVCFRWTCPTDEYTAFKVDVYNGTATNGASLAYSTGTNRIPPKVGGEYRHFPGWKPAAGSTYTWVVHTYNSKWRDDTVGSAPTTFTVPE